MGDLDDLSNIELHLNNSLKWKDMPFEEAALVISHELRHLWQILTPGQSGSRLKSYKTSDKTESIEQYNEQELEVDAWAWASYMMQRELAGIYPTFDFIGEDYTKKVLERAKEIKIEIENIKHIRKRAGLTQKAFAEYFKIPLRTVENWEGGQRVAPAYLVELIEYKLENEGFFD